MSILVHAAAIIAMFWVGMLSSVVVGGLPFLLAAAGFAVLRLTGIIDWSWWWISLPVWGTVGGAVAKMWMVTRDPLWRAKVRQKKLGM